MPDVQARPTVVHGPPRLTPGAITAERYVSPQWLAKEFDQLWPHVWQFACLERDVSEPGQYVVLDIGRESIVVSCGPTITIDQDVHYIRDVQAGMHSRGFGAQKLCDDEVRIQHYHDWLDHWMGNR